MYILSNAGYAKFKFEPSTKSNRGLHNGTSRRRSRYIGVLRNGPKWQVLINQGRTKRYIGTYASEIEAAIVHDFYSIGFNAQLANTNFYYTEETIVEMIQSYFKNGNVFDPSLFTLIANSDENREISA